jgi:hypothetical protein
MVLGKVRILDHVPNDGQRLMDRTQETRTRGNGQEVKMSNVNGLLLKPLY